MWQDFGLSIWNIENENKDYVIRVDKWWEESTSINNLNK